LAGDRCFHRLEFPPTRIRKKHPGSSDRYVQEKILVSL
jgi:hypothetical protein